MENVSMLSLGDYIKESLAFEHSDSNYQLQRECLEFEITSLDYMHRCANICSTDDLLLTNMNESTNMSVFKSKIETRKKNLVDKIAAMWKRIVLSLKTFWHNIINVFTNQQNEQIKTLQIEHDSLLALLEKVREEHFEDMVEVNGKLRKALSELRESERFKQILKDEHFHNISAKNKEIDKLQQNIERLTGKMDAAGQRLVPILDELIKDHVIIDAPETVHDFSNYLDKFRKTLWSKNGGSQTDPINIDYKFIDIIRIDPDNANKVINNINALITEIEAARKKIVKGTIGIDYMKHNNITIEYYLSHDYYQIRPGEDKEYMEEEALAKINDNAELYARYISAVTKLTTVFQTMSAEVIEFTKQYIDDRAWAIKAKTTIYSIIHGILDPSPGKKVV
jgi:ASC-1-like (ASCH) protein